MSPDISRKIYAFIDTQNLYLGLKSSIFRHGELIYTGWKIDMRKFRKYLLDKYDVEKAFLFLGYLEEQENLYRKLRSYGYELRFKTITKTTSGQIKGNVDADLILNAAAVEFANFNQAIIVSGDGDYCSLIRFLQDQQKLGRLLVPNRYAYSRLLAEFRQQTDFLQLLRSKLRLGPESS